MIIQPFQAKNPLNENFNIFFSKIVKDTISPILTVNNQDVLKVQIVLMTSLTPNFQSIRNIYYQNKQIYPNQILSYIENTINNFKTITDNLVNVGKLG
jgi:hypothetical protein